MKNGEVAHNMTEKNLSIEQKRKEKISQLKAKLQKEEALLRHSFRKERNGHLIAFGILVEELFKSSNEAEHEQWVKKAEQHLSDRNLTRALAGFERLKKALNITITGK